jgi:hypothetical protein
MGWPDEKCKRKRKDRRAGKVFVLRRLCGEPRFISVSPAKGDIIILICVSRQIACFSGLFDFFSYLVQNADTHFNHLSGGSRQQKGSQTETPP